MSDNRILVLLATGKVGKNVCIALKEKGFDVYGTTRNAKNNLESKGIKPVVCNYVDKASLTQALISTGIKQVFMITDFFLAAKSKAALEIEQGKMMIDVCKEVGVTFVIYSSAGDLEHFNDKVHHIKSKIPVENYLKASGLRFGIVRPVAFFENLDDPANWNPLKKGSVKFLTATKVSLCATADVGKAAAIMFQNQDEWNEKTVDVVSWKGDINDLAAAWQKVTGVPTTGSLAMPICARSLFLSDLHNMCLYFEYDGGFKGSIEEFKKMVPDAMDAETWFRTYGGNAK